MSYERYNDYRLALDVNGCWDVLTSDYEVCGTYPSKAAAKRAIDEILSQPCDHKLPYIPEYLEMNYGKPIMFKYVCGNCEEEVIWPTPTGEKR